MNCTHGGTAMNIALGDRCPWCLKIVAERTALLATRGGEGAETLPASVAHPSFPAAHIAVGKQDVTRVDGTDRGQPIAALEGFPGSLFDSGVPTAPFAAPSVSPIPAALPAPETTISPVASGAPIKHARNTDPDTARDAALSVTDAHKRRLYDHILALIFEHGPLTDWQLSRFLTVRIGEPVIATSAGKRRGELRDMGLLFDTGFRGPTETGPKKAVRWGLTPAGEVEVAA